MLLVCAIVKSAVQIASSLNKQAINQNQRDMTHLQELESKLRALNKPETNKIVLKSTPRNNNDPSTTNENITNPVCSEESSVPDRKILHQIKRNFTQELTDNISTLKVNHSVKPIVPPKPSKHKNALPSTSNTQSNKPTCPVKPLKRSEVTTTNCQLKETSFKETVK